MGQVYASADKDGNGVLDLSELRALLRQVRAHNAFPEFLLVARISQASCYEYFEITSS